MDIFKLYKIACKIQTVLKPFCGRNRREMTEGDVKIVQAYKHLWTELLADALQSSMEVQWVPTDKAVQGKVLYQHTRTGALATYEGVSAGLS
jgi:hypothetical protein